MYLVISAQLAFLTKEMHKHAWRATNILYSLCEANHLRIE